jgi:hypothetical protein
MNPYKIVFALFFFIIGYLNVLYGPNTEWIMANDEFANGNDFLLTRYLIPYITTVPSLLAVLIQTIIIVLLLEQFKSTLIYGLFSICLVSFGTMVHSIFTPIHSIVYLLPCIFLVAYIKKPATMTGFASAIVAPIVAPALILHYMIYTQKEEFLILKKLYVYIGICLASILVLDLTILDGAYTTGDAWTVLNAIWYPVIMWLIPLAYYIIVQLETTNFWIVMVAYLSCFLLAIADISTFMNEYSIIPYCIVMVAYDFDDDEFLVNNRWWLLVISVIIYNGIIFLR